MALEIYDVGTVSVTQGSDVVTLSAGLHAWLEAWAVPGNQLAIQGEGQANWVREWLTEKTVRMVLPIARTSQDGLTYGMMITASAFGTNRLGALTNIERIRLMSENADLATILAAGTDSPVVPALDDRELLLDQSNAFGFAPALLREKLRAGSRVQAKSANYAIALSDYGSLINVSAAGAARTILLPLAAAVGEGFLVGVKKVDASANAVVIVAAGAETIDDAATLTLYDQHSVVWLRCDGAGWRVTSRFAPIWSDAIPLPQGRVSLLADTPVTESDLTGQVNIHYAPCGGQLVPIYDGGRFVPRRFGAGLVLPLDGDVGHNLYQAAGFNYDLFAINDGGTLRLVSSTAWTAGSGSPGSNLLRGTGANSTELETVQGIPVNKNAMLCRFGSAPGNTVSVLARRATYVGTFRPTANGQATDTLRQRLLFNTYNQTIRPLRKQHAVASWAYSVAAFRAAGGGVDAQVEFLLGLSGGAVELQAHGSATNSTATLQAILMSIGVDSTTASAAGTLLSQGVVDLKRVPMIASYRGNPGLGFHTATKLEFGAGAEVQTWFGGATGIHGTVLS